MSRLRASLVVIVAGAAACASASLNEPGDPIDAPSSTDGSTLIDAGIDAPMVDAAPTPVLLTQNTSMMIGSANSVACGNPDTTTAENSWYRVFRLADAGIVGGLRVTSVEFGVQESVGMPNVQIKIGTYSGNVVPPPAQLDTALITPIAAATFAVPVTQAAAPQTVTVPLTANVPALSQMIVEVFSPDQNGLSRYFYLGGNSGGESKPGYLRAPSCTTPQPRTTAALGFPTSHLVIAVRGTH